MDRYLPVELCPQRLEEAMQRVLTRAVTSPAEHGNDAGNAGSDDDVATPRLQEWKCGERWLHATEVVDGHHRL